MASLVELAAGNHRAPAPPHGRAKLFGDRIRGMLEEAQWISADVEPGRWVVGVIHGGSTWEVIVEPEESSQLFVVVTAYRTIE